MECRDDSKKKAHKEAQAKGMMILMYQRIKFNKKKAYVSQLIFVKCVIISPFLNLLIDRIKIPFQFVGQIVQNFNLNVPDGVGFYHKTVCLTVLANHEFQASIFFAGCGPSYFFCLKGHVWPDWSPFQNIDLGANRSFAP